MNPYRPLPSTMALDLELLAADLAENHARFHEERATVVILVPIDSTKIDPRWQPFVGFTVGPAQEVFAIKPGGSGGRPYTLDSDAGAEFASELHHWGEVGFRAHCLALVERPVQRVRVYVWNAPDRTDTYELLPSRT